MTAWDGDELCKELERLNLKPENIDFLVCSHGHPDHVGNLNLFLNAHHFVGSSFSHKNVYFAHDFEKHPFVLDTDIEVLSTPGHTKSCVSLIVKNTNIGEIVAVTGDLFEKEEDVFDESLWIDAGTEDEFTQRKNRLRIAEMVHRRGWIVPGHGPKFMVTDDILEKLRRDVQKSSV